MACSLSGRSIAILSSKLCIWELVCPSPSQSSWLAVVSVGGLVSISTEFVRVTVPGGGCCPLGCRGCLGALLNTRICHHRPLSQVSSPGSLVGNEFKLNFLLLTLGYKHLINVKQIIYVIKVFVIQ